MLGPRNKLPTIDWRTHRTCVIVFNGSDVKYVSVVLGLITHGDYILVGKKVDHDHPAGLGGLWVLPGSRVKDGRVF